MYEKVPAPEAVEALWKDKAGDAKVKLYCTGGGAAYYISKMIPDQATNYDIGGLDYFPRLEHTPIRGSSNN
jgi:hypothetical protein